MTKEKAKTKKAPKIEKEVKLVKGKPIPGYKTEMEVEAEEELKQNKKLGRA